MAKIDKNAGLSEEQRLLVAQDELRTKQSNDRFKEHFPLFQEEYTQSVKDHGVRFRSVIVFAEGTPDWLKMMFSGIAQARLQAYECREELDQLAQKELQAEMANGAIKD